MITESNGKPVTLRLSLASAPTFAFISGQVGVNKVFGIAHKGKEI